MVKLFLICLWLGIVTVMGDDDLSNTIDYLRNIDSRLARLEKRVPVSKGFNEKKLRSEINVVKNTFKKMAKKYETMGLKLEEFSAVIKEFDKETLLALSEKLDYIDEAGRRISENNKDKDGVDVVDNVDERSEYWTLSVSGINGTKIKIQCKKKTSLSDDEVKACVTKGVPYLCCATEDVQPEQVDNTGEEVLESNHTCEQIKVPLCKDGIGYTYTQFPNFLSHRSQEDAGMEIHQFFPLVKVVCSEALKPLLCTMYTPICNRRSRRPIRPCSSLCNKAQKGCEPLMNKFGFGWPKSLECTAAKSGDICLGVQPGNQPWVQTIGHAFNKQNHRCRPIPNPVCRDVGYGETFEESVLLEFGSREIVLEEIASLEFLYPVCEGLKFLMCGKNYPMCSQGSYLPVCRSTCEEVVNRCVSETGHAELRSMINCRALPHPLFGMCLETALLG